MKTKSIKFILLAWLLVSSPLLVFASETTIKSDMIKVIILYPNGEGKSFDMNYYTHKHMPMVASLLGESLKFYEIDKGIAGRAPSDLAPYIAIGYLYFDKLSDFKNSFGPNADKIRGDVINYTNIQPIVQISKVIE